MHRSVYDDNRVIHVGGRNENGHDDFYEIEIWEIDVIGQFTLFNSTLKLDRWHEPLVFFVAENQYPPLL